MARHDRGRVRDGPSRVDKVRAVLACGVLAGAAGTVTLASWNDAEFAGGTVTASTVQFTPQSATGDVNYQWADHDATTPVAMGFTPSHLVPGAVSAQSLGIRAAEGTVGGEAGMLTPPQATTSDPAPYLADSLTYRVYFSTSNNCTPVSTPPPGGAAHWVVGSGSTYVPLTQAGTTVDSFPAATQGSPGDPRWYCIQVRLDPNAPAGLVGRSTTLTFRLTVRSGGGT